MRSISIILPMAIALAVPTLSALSVSPAQAAATVYNDRASFNSASIGVSTIDFEGLVPGNGFIPISTPPGVTLQGVNFNVTQGNLILAAPINYGPSATIASNGATNLQITLPNNISAVGFDFTLVGDPAPRIVTITLSSGESYSRTSASGNGSPSFQFFGVTSSSPIQFLQISSTNPTSTLVLDNVSSGQAAPEPGSCLLMVAGLLPVVGGYGIGRRKRLAQRG
jgi:hypothetical protein